MKWNGGRHCVQCACLFCRKTMAASIRNVHWTGEANRAGLERQTELKPQTSLNTSSGIWGRATPGLLRSSPAWRGVSEICLGPDNRGCENFSISHRHTHTNKFNKPNNSVCFRVFFCRLFAIKGAGMEVRAGGCGAELRFFLTTKFRIRGVKGTK